jgi:hypothetical protein
MRGLLAVSALALWWGIGVPYSWARDLSPSCAWERRQWASSLHPGTWGPTGADKAREARCWAARGGNDPTGEIPDVKVLLSHFPSAAEVAAWRNP